MKILINTDQIYLHGGIEKVMATKVNYWANLPDVEVFIVTTEQQNNIPCYTLDAKVKLIDLEINYNRTKSYFSKENLSKVSRHYKLQKQVFRDLNPDIIISPNFNFDHYWLPFIKGKAKLIKERHGSRYNEVTQRAESSLIKKMEFKFNDWIDSQYNHIVVLNEDEKKYIKSDNAVVIPNSVDSSDFRANTLRKQVIAAGRISPVKGFIDLIEAWAQVYIHFPDWQLHIYGQDYLETQQKLMSLIEDLKLQEVIQFKGSVGNLTEIMQDYSIYAMTSETECFPMVLLEAQTVGLPIISYDCPNGPRHIICDKNDGVLVEHQNIDVFAQKLMSIMGDKEFRKTMSLNAIQNSKRYTTPEVMKKWSILLNL